jgi:DNA-binding response OmpR family regulator
MRRARILIVEDDPLVAEVICSVLDGDHSVSTAKTVGDALACLRTSDIDVVLVDWGLPDGKGSDIVTLAHQLSVKAVTMSGYPTDGTTTPDAPHLQKPFTLDQLANVLESVLHA